MIKLLDLQDECIAKEVLDLEEISYRIEAELIGFHDIPPLNDSIASLKECDETFYGYFVDDRLAGIISYKLRDRCLNIYRVAVHPDFFRMGIGQAMLCYIEEHNNGVECILVSTGTNNIPARNLYTKCGFRAVYTVEIQPGISITSFEKELNS